MNIIINDLPITSPFRVFDLRTGSVLHEWTDPSQSGDIAPDVAVLPVIGIRSIDGVMYIDTTTTEPEPEPTKPQRLYPYRVTLTMYSGRRESHYIKARNERDAFDKAHRFADPIAMSGSDGVQFITPVKLTKQYCIDHGISFETV